MVLLFSVFVFAEGNDANTVLLLDFEELPLVDSSVGGQPHTIWNYRDSVIQSTNKRFGIYSGNWQYWSEGMINVYGGESDWDFQGEDFTIDLWAYVKRYNMQQYFVYKGGSDFWQLFYNVGTRDMRFWIRNSGAYIVQLESGLNTMPTNQWVHIAAVRHGNNFYLFLNGQLMDTVVSSEALNPSGGISLFIGHESSGNYNTRDTLLDEIRISKGAARWIDDFDVPAEPYYESVGEEVTIPEINFIGVIFIVLIVLSGFVYIKKRNK